MMKRILLITESLGSGGAERQLCGLAAMLTEAGYPCRVISYSDNQYFQPYLQQNHVEYAYLPSLKNRFSRIPRLIKLFRGYKPDVVISFLTHVNVYVCLANLFYKCKLIVSERNNNTSFSIINKLQLWPYRFADYIVPNSYCQSRFIEEHFPVLKHKLKTIINFVNTDYFQPTSVEKNAPITILTIARFLKQKNCLLYLDAIKIIKDLRLPVHFEWYGNVNADDEYYEEIKGRIEFLNIEDYISLHDQVPDVLSLYQKASIFCLPSIFEGYPNVIIEAMSCGLPVLCSNVFENPKIVTEGVNGYLFNPWDPSDIAFCIKKMLMLNEEQRNTMGEQNRKACLNRNSKKCFFSNYRSLIDEN